MSEPLVVREAPGSYRVAAEAQRVRPGYKQTEVGVIPEDWDATRLGDICQIFGRIGFRGYTVNDIVSKGHGAVAISPSNISDSKLVLGNCTYISWAKYEESPEIKLFDGDILLVKTGSTFGKTAIVQNLEEKATLNPQLVVLKKVKIDNLFLSYMMSFATIQDQISEFIVGGALPTLSQKLVAEFNLPLPPTKAEQEAIAEALSDADALIEALEQLIAKKRQLKQGTMQELLSGNKRLPGFSGEWEMKRLGELGNFLKGSGVRKDESLSGDLPCIRYGEIYTKHSDYIKAFYSSVSPEVAATARLLKQGDLLFAGSGETKAEIGKCVAFVDDMEAYAGGDIVILRPEKSNPTFMGFYLNTEPVNNQKASRGQGDAVVHISAAALFNIEIVIPKFEEQTAIATILSDMDAEIAALETRLAKTRELKQGMMHNLLTGKIRLL